MDMKKFILLGHLLLLEHCTPWTMAQSDRVFNPIYKTEAGFNGGIDWIINRSSTVDFILFGEQHGVADIPHFIRDVVSKTQINGFDNLIIESDPLTGEMISDMGIHEFISKYPHALAFDFDGEIALIEFVTLGEEGKQVIWGVDQPVTAMHTLQILEQIALTANTKRICRGLFLKSVLKAGEYLKENNIQDLNLLKDSFMQEKNSSAVRIVDQLISSMEIYNAHRAAKRGEIPYQVSVNQRETFMKKNFDDFILKTNGKKKGNRKIGRCTYCLWHRP
jgi:hypothetical protein